MIRMILLLFLLIESARAIACDCTSYPFKPNPPCYSECVEHLIKDKQILLRSIRDLDPGVGVGISVLRNNDIENIMWIDLSKINNKSSLERAAANIVLD